VCFSFFFCPNKRKTKQKENSPSAFFLPTLVGDCIKEKELASLKQLFLFNVPSLSRRFTAKKRGRTFIFFLVTAFNFASLVIGISPLEKRSL
jgi:hypothetical protein